VYSNPPPVVSRSLPFPIALLLFRRPVARSISSTTRYSTAWSNTQAAPFRREGGRKGGREGRRSKHTLIPIAAVCASHPRSLPPSLPSSLPRGLLPAFGVLNAPGSSCSRKVCMDDKQCKYLLKSSSLPPSLSPSLPPSFSPATSPVG